MSRWEGAVLCGPAAEKGGAARQHVKTPEPAFQYRVFPRLLA
ncbi:hypothetical protein [uncultured Sporomusa sp.]|nr:hypothetical protein [uncultured Sporomusa sp.]